LSGVVDVTRADVHLVSYILLALSMTVVVHLICVIQGVGFEADQQIVQLKVITGLYSKYFI
jgi:hypothetical protein